MEDNLCTHVGFALRQLQHPEVAPEQRKAAEQWLMAFRNSDGAWQFGLAVLTDPTAASDLHLFAGQCLKHKLCLQGHLLSQQQLQQLVSQLLHQLSCASKPASALLYQTCLALCTAAFLLPGWTNFVQSVHASICFDKEVVILRVLAEEAAGSLRHIAVPGVRMFHPAYSTVLPGVLHMLSTHSNHSHGFILCWLPA